MAPKPMLVFGASLVTVLALSASPARAASYQKPLFACQYGQAVRGGIPCSEIDRALSETAAEFRLDERSLRRRAACESSLDPSAGRSHVGLLQQSARYWQGRAADFNRRHPDYPVGVDARNPFWNARVSGDMLARGMGHHWTCPG